MTRGQLRVYLGAAPDIPAALLDFARGVNATQIVLGVSRRGRFAQLFTRGVGVTTAARSGTIDVHLVTHENIGRGIRAPHPIAALSRRRQLAGFAATVLGIPLLTYLLRLATDELSLASDILLFLAGVVGVAVLGGWWPALLAALASSLVIDYFFTPPLHTLDIAQRENLLSLVVFLLVAAAVSAVVDLAARRARDAARASGDAQILSTVAGSVLRGARPLTALLEQLRETFGLTSVTLLERTPDVRPSPGQQQDPHAWQVVASTGDEQCATPASGDVTVGVDDNSSLVLRGRVLAAADRRLIEAFAAQAAVALRQERLTNRAATSRPPAEVENLLDMTRLQTGTLELSLMPVRLAEAVPRALDELGEPARQVRVRLPTNLPAVRADPTLLQRVLVNLLANALQFSPADQPPSASASEHNTRVDLRVVDQGPGIPQDQWTRIFMPFQRHDDRDNQTSLGLGLALSRGLAEAMSGSLTPEQTPGGGLTMVLSLPVAEPSAEAGGGK
ncbi:histidine kinase/DNA gyrase B/HSP90-like ATPase [Micromonospora pisi]|uniref:histidine kinase n=1 Tax=Micromonospora pisi TaxID=589240 RepID=A0A495JVJ1_9ACTN|nr:histidine kinase/DNA gyrase B/HSP90-like ATPase [Micromonospora pisi]